MDNTQFSYLNTQLESLIEKVCEIERKIDGLSHKEQESHTLESLSGEQIARILGIKAATIRKNWCQYGLIRVGRGSHGRHLYCAASVEKHINARKSGAY